MIRLGYWMGCAVCGLDVPEDVSLAIRVRTRFRHAITRRTRWHRQATIAWQQSRVTDRLSQSILGEPDADILGDIQRAAKRMRRPESFPGQQIGEPRA